MRLVLLVGIERRLADDALVEVAVKEVISTLLFGYIWSCPVAIYSLHVVLVLPALQLGVRQQMLLQVHELRIGLAADGTTVWFDSVVDHLVLLQVGPLHKSLVAAVALVRFETTV